jgi:hypothetical protein
MPAESGGLCHVRHLYTPVFFISFTSQSESEVTPTFYIWNFYRFGVGKLHSIYPAATFRPRGGLVKPRSVSEYQSCAGTFLLRTWERS